MSKTTKRHWEILRLIPRLPGKISTKDLTHALNRKGYQVGIRSIQRDLLALSTEFPDVINDGNTDILGWSWRRESSINDLPGIDPPIALAFKLTEQFLSKMLPTSVLADLQPYFSRADKILKSLGKNGFKQWSERIRMVPRSQPLIPAAIDPTIMPVIYTALLERKQFYGRYKGVGRDAAEYAFNPLGLVFQDGVIYLVATVFDYSDARHFALHRFLRAEKLDKAVVEQAGFSLDDHISKGSVEIPDLSQRIIHLVVLFDALAAQHLLETPLSDQQVLTTMADGRIKVEAPVLLTRQLKWWLLGFGAQVQVVRPSALRREFRKTARSMAALYPEPPGRQTIDE
jgi:hypothetical protein